MRKLHVLTMTILVFPLLVLADTSDYCHPTFEDGSNHYFAQSIDEARQALSGICKALTNEGVTEKELNDTLSSFHKELQKEAVKVMPQLSDYLFIFDDPLFTVQGDTAIGMVPDYILVKPDPINPNIVDKITFYYQGRSGRVEENVPKADAQSCFDDDNCSNALIAYMNILKNVYNPLSAEPLKLTLEFLTLKDKEWSTYIEEARSQTFIDITVTSLLHEWKYGKGEHDFQSPPLVQWFALRPNVLIENVSGVVDGDQVKESLALEIIGFNYWKEKCFGYACGASLIINYTDRKGVEDKGWGLMFHVDNSYSFGVTKHGGETGFFVTVDLLKLFQDKKSSFNDYKKQYRSLAN